MRGVLGGILAGAIVSVAVAVGLSVFVGPPSAPRPDAGMAEVPEGSGFASPPVDSVTTLPASDGDAPEGGAPQVDQPEVAEQSPLGGAATQSAAQPEAGAVEQALTAPEAGAEGAEMAAADPEAPVLPNPQAALPDAPETETRLTISTDPAQPPLPEAGGEQTAFPVDEAEKAAEPVTQAEQVEQAEQAEPAERVEQAEQVADTPAAQEPEPAGDATEEVAEAAQPEPAAQEPAPAEVEAPAAEAEAPAGEPQRRTAALPTVTAEEPRPATPRAEAEEAPAPLGQEAAAPESRPTIGKPGISLIDREQAAPVQASDAAPTPAKRPIEAFAAPFENPEDKPKMAIVLMDTGDSPIGLEALSAFPYPISFAVDPTRADAADAMKKYRDAGFEVLALTDLPNGAQPRDAETVLNAAFAALPEAVAVMEGTGTGLQESRAVSDQVAGILAQSGHGLLLFPKGLNTAQKLAAKEGVPAAAVFRDFDDKGQSADVIRRFLDNAAFKAGQEDNGVIMVGRLRPDTVSALLLWGLQDRASRVALAPVSKLLLPE